MGHLTEVQRYTIQALREQNLTIKFIADQLGRDKSVISRELRRNRDQRNGRYDAGLAQHENMNGLIRQHIPKGASLEDIDDEYIEMIQKKLNNRPRKKLGFSTPYEYFFSTFAKNNV